MARERAFPRPRSPLFYGVGGVATPLFYGPNKVSFDNNPVGSASGGDAMSKKEILWAVGITALGYAFYEFVGRPIVSYAVNFVRGLMPSGK